MISDLIPKKSEKFEFRKNFVTIFFSVKNWPKKWNFDLYIQYFVHIHAHANTNYWGNTDKFNMNHIVLHIIRRGILRWFRIWSQKNISAYAFMRKSRLKKFAWADQKNFHRFESGVKFWFEIYPYVIKLKVTTSRIADDQKIEHVRYL